LVTPVLLIPIELEPEKLEPLDLLPLLLNARAQPPRLFLGQLSIGRGDL
jgi:hypothetical protein